MAYRLAISGEGAANRIVELGAGETSFGRSLGNQIVLPDSGVSRRHAIAIVQRDNTLLVDLRSANGTWVNGTRLEQPRVLAVGDRVGMGRFWLDVIPAGSAFELDEPTHPRAEIARFEPRDDTETKLLVQVDARDPLGREVYADWLDDRGLADDASFMRAQDALAAVRRKGDRVALRVLADLGRAPASRVDADWRRRIGRPTIERCAPEFEFRCPKDWSELAPTGDPNVRYCETCTKPVYYATSIEAARDRAANRECVALDLAAPRQERDLEAPYGNTCRKCSYVSGNSDARVCSRCGAELTRPQQIMMGRMMVR